MARQMGKSAHPNGKGSKPKLKKRKVKNHKPIVHNSNSSNPDPPVQFDVQKAVKDDKKVRPKEVFEDYQDPKKK